MKEDTQPLPPAKWSWIAISILLIACVTGPMVAWWVQPHGGDESMAAGIDGAIVALCVFVIGVPFAVAAVLKERRRRVVCAVASVLYAVPLLGLVCMLFVYLANR